ncbi:MAG: hypothetical protein GY913_18695 [Proteobacteria bacterium]|nr:hypothetical protein [Pseudomonadota bacterium]MCP4918939.1 hypothetical protein [Pseudomonadota bacterium]
MLALFALGTAAATPLGSPARSSSDSAVAVQAVAGVQHRSLQTGCEGDRCATWESLNKAGLRADIRAHDAVGVWVSGAYATHSLSGTGHSGQGRQLGAGLSVQLPREGLRPAAMVAAQTYRTTASNSEGEARSTSGGKSLRAAGLAVVGGSEGGASGWLGPHVILLDHNDVAVLPDDVELSLRPSIPVGAVVGGELSSDALGPAWRRSPHLVLGAEAQLIDVWALSTWIGVSY